MERQPYPPPGSCVAKNSQRPASVETVQGGVPPYGGKDTLVVVVRTLIEYNTLPLRSNIFTLEVRLNIGIMPGQHTNDERRTRNDHK